MKSKNTRYILAKISPEEYIFSKEEVLASVINKIKELFGIMGIIKIRLKIIKYYKKQRKIIFACNKEYIEQLIFCLSMVSNINNKTVCIDTEKISGTIKGLIKDERRI